MLRHMTAFASHVTATRLGCQCRSNRNVADTAGIQWMQTPNMQPSHGRHTSTARPLGSAAASSLLQRYIWFLIPFCYTGILQ